MTEASTPMPRNDATTIVAWRAAADIPPDASHESENHARAREPENG